MLCSFLLPNLIPTKFQDVNLKFFGTKTFWYVSNFYAASTYKAEHSERDFIHLNECYLLLDLKKKMGNRDKRNYCCFKLMCTHMSGVFKKTGLLFFTFCKMQRGALCQNWDNRRWERFCEVSM